MQVKSEVFFSFRKFGRLLSGEPLVGVGAPTPCRGALPERRVSFSRLGSKGSLRFVVQLEVAVVQNQ